MKVKMVNKKVITKMYKYSFYDYYYTKHNKGEFFWTHEGINVVVATIYQGASWLGTKMLGLLTFKI
jgi:hypothetical protein